MKYTVITFNKNIQLRIGHNNTCERFGLDDYHMFAELVDMDEPITLAYYVWRFTDDDDVAENALVKQVKDLVDLKIKAPDVYESITLQPCKYPTVMDDRAI